MKVLVLCHRPPVPSGLATQGDLLLRGLRELGVDALACHLESVEEKAWHYQCFRPDVAVGVGVWGQVPELVLHPLAHGVTPIPWLVADGYVAAYQDVLNSLPLVLVTSTWVKETYVRDGIAADRIEVLPVGVDTDTFSPRAPGDERVSAARRVLGLADGPLAILTLGGDAASKGAREVMRALAAIDGDAPDWRYLCKVWPQPRTHAQNVRDLALAAELGIADRVSYVTSVTSRDFTPYLIAACDVYAGPSRLEGFGMPHVEANACERPVLAIDAMAFRDTQVHGDTALLAAVGREVQIQESLLDDGEGRPGRRVVFDVPKTVGYRADVPDLARHMLRLLEDADLRRRLGAGGRRRAIERFHYRTVARRCLELLRDRLGID